MASVVLDDVGKSYYGPGRREREVLKQVHLAVSSGELLVLVGPSGSGKTTLLRLIAGLENLTRGSLRIDGQPMDKVAAKDRDLAMVFQNDALFPHLTVHENMAMGLRLRGVARDAIDRNVRETAALLGLTPLLPQLPGTLSGGERRRVALGRAWVRRPKVFLFDEPLANLDAPMKAQLRREIRQLHDRFPATMIYVTHDQSEALALADRVAVLHAGRLEQIADPTTLYHHPATRFVAEFLGSPPMNLISGRLVGQDNAVCFEPQFPNLPGEVPTSLWRWPVPSGPAGRLRVHLGKRVVLGIRPEHLVLSAINPLSDQRSGRVATLIAQTSAGAWTEVQLQCGLRVLNAQVPAGAGWTKGQTLGWKPDGDQVHFFEESTGQAI